MLKILMALSLVLVLQGLVSPRASAQDNCKTYDTYCAACGDPVLPGMHNCEQEAPFIDVCQLPNWKCVPAAAASETAPKCNCAGPPSSSGTPTGGQPVVLANGDTFIIENDIKLPGLGGGLSLTRRWNSLWPSADSAYQIGMFGPNWRSTYEEQVFVGTDYYFKYLQSDGSILSFGYGPGAPSKYANRFNSSVFLMLATPVSFGHSSFGDDESGGGGGGGGAGVYIAPSYFTIYFGDGEQRRFDINSGKLVAIIDRNGNTTTISHDSLGRVSTVTDPASRHLYFSYDGGGALVTSVTTDFGVSLSYSYDTQGRLIQVTEPDSSTISYQYNSQSLITAVLDSNGNVLEAHTYDSSGRGLTSSRANGVDSVTLSYSN